MKYIKMRLCILLVVILALSYALPAFSADDELRIGLVSDVLTWDTHNYRATTDKLVHDFVYDTLLCFDREMEIKPALATSWEMISPTVWEFELRKGVTFSDGTPFNGEVAKFNLLRCAKAPRGSSFAGIIKDVDVLSEDKIRVYLKQPCAGFLNNLASINITMLSPAAIEKAGKNFVTALPVGTGKYEVIKVIPNNMIVLEAKKSYWIEKTPFKKIVFKVIPEEATRLMALRNNEIDLMENVPPHEAAAMETYGLQLLKMPRNRVVWLGMNVGYGPLKDLKVREAISLAVNKNDIVAYVLEDMGIVADTFIPNSVHKGLEQYPIKQDVEKAKKLMKEAGYPDGFEIKLTTTEARYLRDKQVSEVIQQQLKAININVKINVMEWGSFLTSLGKHEGELFLVGWGFTTGTDPLACLRQTCGTGDAFNYSNYSSSVCDNLLISLDNEFDEQKRIEIMNNLNKLLAVDDRVVIPIYHMYSIWGARKNLKDVFIKPNEMIDVSIAKFE